MRQWEILMQQARIYRAWFPSEIFWNYGNDVTGRKQQHAAWVFDVLLNSTREIGNPRAKT